jgi:hypothetical protein
MAEITTTPGWAGYTRTITGRSVQRHHCHRWRTPKRRCGNRIADARRPCTAHVSSDVVTHHHPRNGDHPLRGAGCRCDSITRRRPPSRDEHDIIADARLESQRPPHKRPARASALLISPYRSRTVTDSRCRGRSRSRAGPSGCSPRRADTRRYSPTSRSADSSCAALVGPAARRQGSR